MDRRYDFEGSVYVSEDELKDIAKEFLEAEGSGKEWDDLTNYLWDNYSEHQDWDQVMDDITDDVFEIYEELTGKGNEEE